MNRSEPDAPRPRAPVAVTLLETVRDLDLPAEVFEDERISLTLPRRFGLSEVVDAQIRRHREQGRARLPAGEFSDLARLILRRPDAAEVFLRAGESLGRAHSGTIVPGFLPAGIRRRWSMRALARTVEQLLGIPVRIVPGGGLRMESSRSLVTDPNLLGIVCALVTGCGAAFLSDRMGKGFRVVETQCRGRGDRVCAWEAEEENPDSPAG